MDFLKLTKLLGAPENFSVHGGRVDHMDDVIHWLALVLMVGWGVFFIYTLWRYHHSRSPKASYYGTRSHISSHLEIGVVIIEVTFLLGFAFPLWKERSDSWEVVQQQNPVRVRVVGWQFGWTYHYSGLDHEFGRIDHQLKTANSDVGLDLNDPNAWDDFVSPVLRVPVNRPVILNITSNDVIHNYSIVPLRIQQDAIPGKEIPMWFTAVKTFETSVICGQLCGENHGNMVTPMEVISEQEFADWSAQQSKDALERNTPKKDATASR